MSKANSFDRDDRFGNSAARIKAALTVLGEQDAHMKAAIALINYPAERRMAPDFTSLLRVIAGQQLSTKAAATIFARLSDLLGGAPTPALLLAQDEKSLRAVGLSMQKITYVQSLAEAIDSGRLDLPALTHLSDEEAIAALITVKGLGRWSAEMYLMFALGRPDIWPVNDLGVQEGVKRILRLEQRPKPKEMADIGLRWQPYRSAAALMAWHYCTNAPV